MPYFPVDDQAAFHPKILAAGNAAVGVWTRAGAWCKAHASGGFVRAEIAHAIGSRSEVRRLVAAGLWTVAEENGVAGFRFHDWSDQAGNFDAETEKARRESERERWRERKRAERERKKSQGHGDSHGVTPGGVSPESRTPPSPSPKEDQDLTSHPDLSSTLAEDDMSQLDPVIAAVVRATAKGGLRISPLGAPALIQFIDDRRGPRAQPIKLPIRYYPNAIAESWAEVSKFIHEEGIAS